MDVINKATFCYNGHCVPLFGPANGREGDDGRAIRNRCTITESSVSVEGGNSGVHWVKQEAMCDGLFVGRWGRKEVYFWTLVISHVLHFVLFCFLTFVFCKNNKKNKNCFYSWYLQ